jgi:hypothetical protein
MMALKHKARRRGPLRIIDDSGKPIPQSVLIDASYRFMERRNSERVGRRMDKLTDSPDRPSVERGMLLVEDALCKAFWVLARLPNDRGAGYANRHGLDYMPEKEDRDYAIASGGDWHDEQPRPPVPSGKEIDAMHQPMEWLRLLDRDHARVLATGVRWKHGESCRKISWPRLRVKYPEFANYSTRTLQRRYNEALRTIVSELSLGTIASLARQW